MRSVFFLTCMAFVLSAHAATRYPPKKCSPCENPCSTPGPVPCQNQGEPLTCYGPAFNAPAAMYVNPLKWKGCPFNYTGFVDFSFTYWYAAEEGLKLASSGVLSSATDYYGANTKSILQSSDYKPGFKVGAGIVGYHEWMIAAEYTWFRARNTTSSGPVLSGTQLTAGIATSTAASGTPVWLIDDWFLQGTPTQALSGSSFSSSWRLSMDLVDAIGGRPFYQGPRFTVSPFGGLRAAFIRQAMTVTLTESSSLFSGAVPPYPIKSHNHSNSWAIGPRGGCSSQYLLPMGFRLEGSGAVSLLYTRFTSIKHREDAASTSFNPGPYTSSYNGYSVLLPELDLGLGFGWGRYIYNQGYHIDFSADYDFMLFWSQNMMRKFLDDPLTGTSPSSANLFLHGVTLSGKFDF